MENCIFCKIIKGDIPSFKYWEDKDFICILDINPNVKGASVMISKQHTESDLELVPDNIVTKAGTALKQPIQRLKSNLKAERVGVAIEGLGVNHFHIKLYPFYDIDRDTIDNIEKVTFTKYPGYLSTQMGPRESDSELSKIFQLLI